MDPVTIGVAASAALASTAGKSFADKAGAGAWSAVVRLREKIVERFTADHRDLTMIEKLGSPLVDASGVAGETDRQAAAQAIAEVAAADPGFRAELEDLLLAARRDPALASQIAIATDHARQINIGGDNSGSITL